MSLFPSPQREGQRVCSTLSMRDPAQFGLVTRNGALPEIHHYDKYNLSQLQHQTEDTPRVRGQTVLLPKVQDEDFGASYGGD